MARLKDKRDRAARQARVSRVADVLRQYTASPFEFEAACVHGLRAGLCRQGWDWQAAHHEARETVLSALDRIGARRPSWDMGQPEYALRDYGDFVERTRCAWCHGAMPEGRPKYCSDFCNHAAKDARKRIHHTIELAVEGVAADLSIQRIRSREPEQCAA